MDPVHFQSGAGCLGNFARLWQVNAPYGPWVLILGGWGGLAGFLVLIAPRLRRRLIYQAIWGPSPEHPGNRRQDI